MPTGSSDQTAAALAAEVGAGGPTALPALLAAVQAAGFGVKDTNGGLVIHPGSPSQGFAIDRTQAVALGMAAVSPTYMSLADLAATVAIGIPALKRASTASMLLDSIRSHAADNGSTTRFWAHFIIELGKLPGVGRDPYDLASSALDPASVHLDLIQVEMILFRLDADIAGLRERLKRATGMVPPRAPSVVADAYAEGGSGPCNLTDVQSQIMDAAAMTSTTGFDKLMEYLKESEHLSATGTATVESISRITGMANVLLAYMKVVLYYSALQVDVSMDGSGPLIRTKNSQPGEQRHLVGHARFDFKNGQMINCLRIMLNGLGMDLSGPSDGALAGSVAEWHLLKGGVSSNSTASRIVQFFGGDPVHQQTDEKGQATIGIEGYPQKGTLRASVTEVTKEAEVSLLVQPKPPSFSQDMIDASAAAVAGVVGLGTVPAEMLLRSNLLKPAGYRFKVTDWELPLRLTIEMKTVDSDVNPPSGFGCGFDLRGVSHVMVSSVAGSIPLTWQEDGSGNLSLIGGGPLDVESVTPTECQNNTRPQVANAKFSFGAQTGRAEPSLQMQFCEPGEVTGAGVGVFHAFRAMDGSLQLAGRGVGHPGEVPEDCDSIYTIKGWQLGDAPVIAIRSYHESTNHFYPLGGHLSEDVTFKVEEMPTETPDRRAPSQTSGRSD